MPLSLMGASVFSEALWQRVWASQDERTLRAGAYISCGIIISVVFISGFFGFLAAWAGLIDETTNPNLYMFQVQMILHLTPLSGSDRGLGLLCSLLDPQQFLFFLPPPFMMLLPPLISPHLS